MPELNDDTVATAAMGSDVRVFGAESAAASAPTSYGRAALYATTIAALSADAAGATAALNNVVGDSGAGGTKGLVPAPAAGDAAAGKFLKANGAWAAPGDVAGPASATDNALVRFDLTTGKLVQNSGVIIDDNDGMTGLKRHGGVFFATGYGVTASGSDESTAMQAALTAVATAGGGVLQLPRGTIRCDSQLTYDATGLWLRGAGCGGPEGAVTTLDLRYASGAKVLLGNGTTRRNSIRFSDFHIVDGAAAAQYIFESRYVRGLKFNDITTGSSVYGFAKLGRSGEATSYVVFENMWDVLLAATSQHFIDCVNVPGPIQFVGHGHIEGPATIVAGSCFCNFSTTSVRPDGVQMAPGWTVRQFSRGLNFRSGLANADIVGVIFDEMLDYGIYADTDAGAVGGLRVQGCRFNSDAVATAARGIFISKTTSSCLDVDIQGNTFYEWGAEGIWLTGAMDAKVIGNKVANCGQATTNNYAGIRIGTDITGVVTDNTIITNAANVHQYGVLNQSTSVNLRVGRNVSVGHGTAPVSGFCDEMSFKATKGGVNQTAILSGTPTKLTFGTELWDVGLGYDTTNSRWTPGPGKVLIGGGAYVGVNVVNGSSYILSVYKNGALLNHVTQISAAGTNALVVAGSTEDDANATDYYELWFEGGGAGDKTVNGTATVTYFWGKKLP